MKPGTRVRMSESLRVKLMGACGQADRHLGPFYRSSENALDDLNDCFGCSWAHEREFGNCEGVVQGLVDYNGGLKPGQPGYDSNRVGPEVDVRWKPSNLRYAYHPEDLEIVTDTESPPRGPRRSR